MAQQYITIISVADYGMGKSIIDNPGSLTKFKVGRQEDHPWMLYYSKWFDPWLMGDSISSPSRVVPKVVFKPVQEDMYSFRPTAAIEDRLKKSLRRKFQYREQLWYNWHLIQAMHAYKRALPKRKIFVVRTVMSVSLGDRDIVGMLRK